MGKPPERRLCPVKPAADNRPADITPAFLARFPLSQTATRFCPPPAAGKLENIAESPVNRRSPAADRTRPTTALSRLRPPAPIASIALLNAATTILQVVLIREVTTKKRLAAIGATFSRVWLFADPRKNYICGTSTDIPAFSFNHFESSMSSETGTESPCFFYRHEFAIRRLHSLSGIVPLGAYMVVHLTTNASLLNNVQTFQRAVYMIHSLGKALVPVEWALIFFPLLFHAIVGVWIARTGHSNTDRYRFPSNRRYRWQRITGIIAFIFLMTHVLHQHGWIHLAAWVELGQQVGFAQFKPYNAASTLAASMTNLGWKVFYLLGVWACVYHLANGLWTAGITWGVWTTAAAQRRAQRVCNAFGVLLLLIGTSAWWAAISTDPVAAKQIEDDMYRANLEIGAVPATVEKRSQPDPILGTPAD